MKILSNASLPLLTFISLTIFSCNSVDRRVSSSATDTFAVDTSMADTTTAGNKELFDSLENESKEKWNYSQNEDKMSGKTSFYANVAAKNRLYFSFPYEGGTDVTLHVRKKGTTDVFITISQGQFTGESVRVRFGKEPAKRWATSNASDGSSEFRFIDQAQSFISKLKKHEKFIIEAEFYQEGLQLLEFDADKLKWQH